jgi:hypothetical protein
MGRCRHKAFRGRIAKGPAAVIALQSPSLARIPAKWDHFAEKDSRQINILEQILVAKVFNFGGICSKVPDVLLE